MFATLYDLDNIDFCRSQVTAATAIVYCHRFYLHQSHAKNDWQVGLLTLSFQFMSHLYFINTVINKLISMNIIVKKL